MALASSGKVLKEEAILSLVHVLHECPDDASQRVSTYLFNRIKYASRQ